MREIALVTCARLPDLDPDDRALIAPLAERGCRAVPAIWDDAGIDWDRFDLAVLRSPWDYTDRRDDFVAWARAVPRLANSADVVAWNTDKRYLRDLHAAGVAVVATDWLEPSRAIELPFDGEYVLKPAVGAGSMEAGRFDLGDSPGRARAIEHATRLLAMGQVVMVQPFAHAIEDVGETGVIMIDGEFSHGMRKGPMLGVEDRAQVEGLYVEETIDPRTPSAAEVDLARRAVAAAPEGGADLLYARVDMVPGDDGAPMIMELELTEPSLFMATAPGSAVRFADAIVARIRRGRARAPARRARPQQEREVS